MIMPHSRIYAKIDLDAVRHNAEVLHSLLKPDTKIMAVIKADGYGHGAEAVAQAVEHMPCLYGFAAATAEEALSLRRHGIKKPVLILGYVFPEHYPMLVQQEIRLCVFTLEMAVQISEAAAKAGRDALLHIKLDTGMSRIGIRALPENVKLIAQIAALPHIVIEGIFTHFASADETDKTAADRQLALFNQMLGLIKDAGITIPIRHCANSAAIISLPQAQMDLVRAGILLYGLWPSDAIFEEAQKRRIDLRPALELKSHIAYVKELEAGCSISYGGTYTTTKPEKIATIPIGYADGYPRSLSNKGCVLIHGRRAPIRGRICMDQFMADVTDIADARAGDLVTLAGVDGTQRISLEELGGLSGRFNYEFACGLGKRIPRIYTDTENLMP